MPGRTLFVAGRVHTLAGGPSDATAVLAADGRIVAVGAATDLAGDADSVVDYGPSAVITPGLVDGHSHPVWGLRMTAGPDLTDALDLAEVRRTLLAARAALAPGEWLHGWGLNPIVFGGEEPSAAALGPALDGVPAMIQLYDGHSVIASAPALALAGITGSRAFASSARIAVDAAGVPTGYLLEAEAAGIVEDAAPEPTPERQAADLDGLLHGLAAVGYTGIHAMDFRAPAQELVTRLEAAGELPIRIGFNPMLMPEDDGPEAVLPMLKLAGRHWRVEGVKLVVDGTIDGGTAWLEYADTHGEGLGSLWRDVTAFREAVTVLHRAGVNCAVHAIGDRAVREVVGVFADLKAEYGPLAQHRIEHIETLPDETVALFAGGAAAASMQPLHITCFNNADRTDSWSRRLGDVRVDHGFRWHDLRAAGVPLALGSDWPIAPYDPRWIMADARLRHRFDRPGATPMQPEQTLTAVEALEGFTSHAALASGEADRRGRLLPGFDADLTIFAEDPLQLPPEDVAQVDILGTVVAGAIPT